MGKRKSGRDIHGILLLDKRLGISSNRALQEVKRLFNANKAGHTGSLDPLASGLLPLCFGEATKVSALMLDDNKRYQVDVKLGVMTDTGDAEGQVIAESPVPELTEIQILNCLQAFIGEIEQVPPMYSALKVNGRKLYELAREGKVIERQARRIHIFDITLLKTQGDLLTLDVSCSKGTYIRSLAEDIGHRLGCGGAVTALRRLQAGQFYIDNAWQFEQLEAMDFSTLQNCLLSVDIPLSIMPSLHLPTEQAVLVKQGQVVSVDHSLQGMVRMYSELGFLGLGEIQLDGKLAPKKIFNLTNEAVS